ncbi:MAG: 2-oxoacid:acceptor oxidoreductase family protein [Spirochaetales bacterium]
MITAAIVLAEAALFYEGLNAVQTQVYGPEARGGSARSDVIISDDEIWFPKVLEPNVLVCLSQMAYDRFSSQVRPGGIVVTDPHFVKRWAHASSREVAFPLHATAADLGPRQSVSGINMCLLGVLSRLIPVVRLESLKQVVAERFPGRFLASNLKALEAGAGLVTESVATF